jgi:hypothetical protein
MALVDNPLFARYFARFGGRNEERGNRELRKEMLAGLAGRVMEVGPGNGLNFPHYPLSVQEVVAVEPEPCLRSRDILFAGYQQAADLVWPRLMGGCHVQRQTRAAIDEVFTIETCRGFRFPSDAFLWPVAPPGGRDHRPAQDALRQDPSQDHARHRRRPG